MKAFLIYLFNVLMFLNIHNVDLVAQNKSIADEIQYSLINEILDVWYPRTVDKTYGGFLSDFDYEWDASGRQNKMLVSQTRHVWTTSKMGEFLKDDKYKSYAKNGFDFLKSKMWDFENKGFYFLRDREGNEISSDGNSKSSYSNAFAIYALAEYYKISQDKSALELAKETFYWLEKNAHDPINKGYFDLLREGGSFKETNDIKYGDRYSINPTWKDQNSSIHLLEAFTELYSVWPNTLLRERLSEMLFLVRDVITTEKGYLTLYLTNDWQPITFRDSSREVREANTYLDHVSFGHDVETAFLLLEASHVLGFKNDVKTLSIAKKMVDHSLKFGWDNDNGGFYYEGYYFKGKEKLEIINYSKVWWVEAEGLNALLLMAKLYPEEQKYYEAFLKQWEYIKEYLVDHKNYGWYMEGLDKSPHMKTAPKAFDWKVNYHNVRSLMNCIEMLREN
jgi:cellobiose epimerase